MIKLHRTKHTHTCAQLVKSELGGWSLSANLLVVILCYGYRRWERLGEKDLRTWDLSVLFLVTAWESSIISKQEHKIIIKYKDLQHTTHFLS